MPEHIHYGSFEEVLELRRHIPEFDREYSVSDMGDRIGNSDYLILIGETEGFPVGFITCYDRDQDGTFYLWWAGVIPQYRGSPIFGLLMREMDSEAKRRNYSSIRVKTFPEFGRMISFLKKDGYQQLSIDNSSEELLYEKLL